MNLFKDINLQIVIPWEGVLKVASKWESFGDTQAKTILHAHKVY